MTEQFRPHPENPKQHAPEAGAGPIGLPPPGPEQPKAKQAQQENARDNPLAPHGQEHQGTNLSATDQEILAKLQEASEFWGDLPHPLAPEFKYAMIKRAVEEAFRKINWEEMRGQIENMDEEVMEALQDPILRKKLLEGD